MAYLPISCTDRGKSAPPRRTLRVGFSLPLPEGGERAAHHQRAARHALPRQALPEDDGTPQQREHNLHILHGGHQPGVVELEAQALMAVVGAGRKIALWCAA